MIHTLYHWGGYNKALSVKIHHLTNNETFYSIMKFASAYAGNYLMSPVTIPLAAIFIYLVFKLKKNDQTVQYCVNSLKCFVAMFISFIVMAIIVKLLKSYFAMPRPYCSIEPELIKDMLVHKSAKCFRSFPSGHTSYSTILIASLWPIMNKWFKGFGAAFVAIVATSRIAMAMHYPVDVVCSIIASLVVVLLVSKLINKLDKRYKSRAFDVCKCLTS